MENYSCNTSIISRGIRRKRKIICLKLYAKEDENSLKIISLKDKVKKLNNEGIEESSAKDIINQLADELKDVSIKVDMELNNKSRVEKVTDDIEKVEEKIVELENNNTKNKIEQLENTFKVEIHRVGGEDIKSTILEDSKEKTITLIEGDIERYLVERNNLENTSIIMKLQDRSKLRRREILSIELLKNESVETTVIDFNLEANAEIKEDRINRKRRDMQKEDTFSNYEYEIKYGNPNKWVIQRPDGRGGQLELKLTEKRESKKVLNEYKESVDSINKMEKTVISYVGLAIFLKILAVPSVAAAIFTGGAASGAVVASTIAAAGTTAEAANHVFKLTKETSKAYSIYMEIKYDY